MNNLTKSIYVLNVSGGKDSLFLFDYILANHLPLNEVATVDLDICNPIENIVKDYIEEKCIEYGIPFRRFSPPVSYASLFLKYGPPSADISNRWCHKKYKAVGFRIMEDYYKNLGFYQYIYIGICADESKRLVNQTFDYKKHIFPLVDNGISERTILEWARQQPLFRGWYDRFNRLGCIVCPFMSVYEIEWLKDNNLPVYNLQKEIVKIKIST